MNLPNKITMARIVLSILLIVFLIFPFDLCGIDLPKYLIGKVTLELKYIIGGVIFLIASVTDSLDGHIARSRNLVTDFGKVMDAIADKVLVNGVLIILAFNSFIPLVVPVIIITRDIVVDAIKMQAASKGKVVAAIKSGKFKTATMMVGLTLVFFGNLPFELIGIQVAKGLVYAATVLSIVSGIQYYSVNKDAFKEK